MSIRPVVGNLFHTINQFQPGIILWTRTRGSRTPCPSMAHSSCDGQVGYIFG